MVLGLLYNPFVLRGIHRTGIKNKEKKIKVLTVAPPEPLRRQGWVVDVVVGLIGEGPGSLHGQGLLAAAWGECLYHCTGLLYNP